MWRDSAGRNQLHRYSQKREWDQHKEVHANADILALGEASVLSDSAVGYHPTVGCSRAPHRVNGPRVVIVDDALVARPAVVWSTVESCAVRERVLMPTVICRTVLAKVNWDAFGVAVRKWMGEPSTLFTTSVFER